jgi:hypothetical protein
MLLLDASNKLVQVAVGSDAASAPSRSGSAIPADALFEVDVNDNAASAPSSTGDGDNISGGDGEKKP